MKPNKIFLLIACVYLAGFSAHAVFLKKTVYGDGAYYYGWLRNAVVDRSIDSSLPGIKYSIGPAILWAPGFLWVHTVLRGTGNEFPYQVTVGLMSVLYALTGLVLLHRFVGIASVAAITGASNLLFYGAVDPVNSHAVSFFAATVFLSLLFSKQKNWLAIGAVLGLIGLIRPQDLIYGILCIPSLVRSRLARHRLLFGFLIFFTPQLLAWYATTGNFISPYLTGHEGFDFFRPHIVEVLFLPQNGLFLWTPIVLLGCIGLWKKQKIFLSIFLLQVLMVASWSSWNQGASYSGRMFVSVLPLVAFGLANLFEKLQKIRLEGKLLYLSAIIPLTLVNMLLIVYFLLYTNSA